jgi:hypothetical protein
MPYGPKGNDFRTSHIESGAKSKSVSFFWKILTHLVEEDDFGYHPLVYHFLKLLMRQAALFVLLVALAPAGLSANTVQIQEVGLQGYYLNQPTPTRVEVLLTNPASRPQTLSLRFRIVDLAPEIGHPENQFSISVNLGPSEQRIVTVPLLIFAARRPAIEIEARDDSGKLVGTDKRSLEQALIGHLIAVVCVAQDVCKTVQSEISFSGSTAEQTQKGKLLKFVWVRQPPVDWWSYSAAKTIVVAAPLKQLSEAQRIAIESALRQGHQLILIEDQVQDSEFLASYREGPIDSKPQPIGRGMFLRVGKLSGPQLGQLFSEAPLSSSVADLVQQQLHNDELSWIIRRLATLFRFPRLGWLLAWLGAYILVIGLLNFAILQRLRRREWGWITVPAGAVLFSVLLYLWSASQRPKTFGIDELAVFWMDERSPVAASELGLRVSSPKQRNLSITVPGQVVFDGSAQQMGFPSFSSLTVQSEAAQLEWDVQLGPPWQSNLLLLKWSFRDLEFHGMKVFSGTVHRNGESRLRNDTGIGFSQAIYVSKEKVYFLGRMGSGTEIDLNAVRQESLSSATGRNFPYAFGYPATLGEGTEAEPATNQTDWKEEQKGVEEWRQLPYRPFELVELIRSWPHNGGNIFDSRSGVFFGLSDESSLQASLQGVPFTKKSYGLTIVSFEQSQ